ncbi:hypothetical protein [Arenimonas sp.]|uniref:hypothetical protein n=1 Tax=Arenimonas sp. TaxID=1872635 RepID=UPI0035B3A592
MTTTMENTTHTGHRLRPLVWGGAAALLLLPAVAMQFTEEVQWDGFDFLVMGGMLLAVCLAYETAVRFARSNACLVAAAIAVGASFLTVWANLAVGIIGSENNPVNDIFFGVVAVAVVGALLARLRPRGLAWAMLATAVAQVAACLYAWLGGHGHVFVFTGVMCGLWLTAAQLFRNSASA